MRRLLLLAFVAVLAPDTSAGTKTYTLEVPDRLDALYEVGFDVAYPGRVVVDARWGGGRILSFRLEAPGSPPIRTQRSGPSPQRIELVLADGNTSVGATWRLVVRALPGKGASQVTLSVETPGAVAATPPPATAPAGEVVEEVSVEPWARPASPPLTAPPALSELFRRVERIRGSVVLAGGEFASDPCSWHSDFLLRVTALRDAAATGRIPMAPADRSCLARFAGGVRRVDELRQSGDPLLAGPVPTDPYARIVWRARRGDRIRPLEAELDSLLEDLRQGRCFERLQGDVWPARFAACLIACERYFEERVRIGDDAANAELAQSEWARYLDAAAALEALIASPGSVGSPASTAESEPPARP